MRSGRCARQPVFSSSAIGDRARGDGNAADVPFDRQTGPVAEQTISISDALSAMCIAMRSPDSASKLRGSSVETSQIVYGACGEIPTRNEISLLGLKLGDALFELAIASSHCSGAEPNVSWNMIPRTPISSIAIHHEARRSTCRRTW